MLLLKVDSRPKELIPRIEGIGIRVSHNADANDRNRASRGEGDLAMLFNGPQPVEIVLSAANILGESLPGLVEVGNAVGRVIAQAINDPESALSSPIPAAPGTTISGDWWIPVPGGGMVVGQFARSWRESVLGATYFENEG